MQSKINVAIVFGGRSTEHAISLLSAQNVYNYLDKDKYNPILIGIDKSGQWHYNEEHMHLLNSNDASKIKMEATPSPVLLSQNTNEKKLISSQTNKTISEIDVIFPVLHGTYGEDGSIQGLAKLANIPVVGCGILGSAIGMDKDIMKRVLRDSNINVAPWITIRNNSSNISYLEVKDILGSEVFIKPANLGSSVGVSYCKSEETFEKSLDYALKYDHKVIIEKKILGREIECAVLGNSNPKASIPGEIIPQDGFYSFENKYLDENGAVLKIPADLTDNQVSKIQALSLETYSVLECRGMSRIDMFMTENEDLIINEINTIPGFTNISMYPKLWEHTGVTQKELISKLIELAIDEHQRNNYLKLD